jgi:2,4-dienoyl-CoA reductase-like NADH-dependent reductase (Old Yellow Enzyme family)
MSHKAQTVISDTDDIAKFRAEVESYILETGITPTGFGRKFTSDPNFVFRLKKRSRTSKECAGPCPCGDAD